MRAVESPMRPLKLRVLAVMQTLCLFALSPTGFRHRDVRAHVAQLLGRDPDALQATVEEYNAACAAGVDAACGIAEALENLVGGMTRLGRAPVVAVDHRTPPTTRKPIASASGTR